MAELYPEQALHKDLFDPSKVDEWVLPEVHDALRAWREGRDAKLVDLEACDAHVEAPGVVSFALLKPEVCRRLLEESRNFVEESGLPQQRPNSMNRCGCVLNEIGMRPALTELFRSYLWGVGARLFGEGGDRAESLGGVPLETQNWGGSTLSDHYTFMVRYTPDTDRGLDMHVDEADVTFNIGLTEEGVDYDGGDLAFCGMFGQESYRRKSITYRHQLGRCVVHAGKRRHSVLDVEFGERASLVVWTKSILFRNTDEYKAMCGDFVSGRKRLPQEEMEPDKMCLSMTHDGDYLEYMR